MHIILLPNAVVDVFAVMIELLHTSLASVAVVAVSMHIHLAFLTKNKQLHIPVALLVPRIQQSGVHRVADHQSAVLYSYRQHEQIEEETHYDQNWVVYCEY